MKINEFLISFKYAFRPNKPLLILRLLKAFVRSTILKIPTLRYVDFAINFNCNLNCNHCFASTLNKPGRKVMLPVDYENIVTSCMHLGAVNFSFQGGEPLLNTDLFSIISSCFPSKNLISVTTNGTLLTEELVYKLKIAGVDILTVSLDSSIPEEHDKFRNLSGAHAKTIKGIQLALNAGLNVTIGAVVTHNTLKTEGFKGLISIANNLNVILNIILPVSAGKWSNCNTNQLTEEDLKYIYDLTNKSKYIRTDFQANLGHYGCGAAKEILYITPYGDVLTCPFIHISFGNIFTDSIETIRKRMLNIYDFKHYNNKCLASTDKNFIDKYLSLVNKQKDLPANYKDIFHS